MKVEFFVDQLKSLGINTIAGIPDSTLKVFCDYLNTEGQEMFRQYTPSNEGSAIGLAVGSYLAEGKPACVYMQNSGLGNTVNPLTSIANEEVYGIPMLLIVGWRGEPGVKDEPQHKFMGAVTEKMVELLDVEYAVVGNDTPEEKIREVFEQARRCLEEQRQYCIIVKRNAFEKREMHQYINENNLKREEAIQEIISSLDNTDAVFSTTGKISREVYESSDFILGHHRQDFLTVGGMGHASMIAMGFAQSRPAQRVYCIDGDGAVFMHLGNLGYIGKKKPNNLIHICLNNFAHESVGGMPTGMGKNEYVEIAKSCGYPETYQVTTKEQLKEVLQKVKERKELTFIEIMVSMASRDDLGRPKEKAKENRISFMEYHKEG